MSCIPGLLYPPPSLAFPRPRLPRIIRPLWDGMLALTAGKRPRDTSNGKRYRKSSDGKRQRCCCVTACANCNTGTTPKQWTLSVSGVSVACTGTCFLYQGGTGSPTSVIADSIPDPNGTFTLTQNATFPCEWDGTLTGSLSVRAFSTLTCAGTAATNTAASLPWKLKCGQIGGIQWLLTLATAAPIGPSNIQVILFQQLISGSIPTNCRPTSLTMTNTATCGGRPSIGIYLASGGTAVLTPV